MEITAVATAFIVVFLATGLFFIIASLLHRNSDRIVPAFQMVFSLLVHLFCLCLAYTFYVDSRRFLFVHKHIFGLSFHLEPLGIIFLVMVSFLWLLTNVYSLGYFGSKPRAGGSGRYYFSMLASICSAMLLAISGNLITAFLSYELLTIFTFPLIMQNGTQQEAKAASKYILTLLFFSLTLLVPAIVLLLCNAGDLEFSAGGVVGGKLSMPVAVATILMFIYGIAKTAVMPAHIWLPAAMIAPVPVSALLHAVAVVKAGLFLLTKILVYIYGVDYLTEVGEYVTAGLGFNLFAALIGASVVVAGLIALRQTKLKSLLAYSTINHMSICLLPLTAFSINGVKASVLHMIAHAVTKITLFFAVGYWEKEHSVRSVDQVNARLSAGGLLGGGGGSRLVAAIFTIAALSAVGIPPLAGFISKAYVFYALTLNKSYVALLALGLSVLISAQYFVRVIWRLYWGTDNVGAGNLIELNASHGPIGASFSREKFYMQAAMAITCACILFYGGLVPVVLELLDKVQFVA